MPIKLRWTLENIRAGLERFKGEHERYPTSREIDASAYLPSSRQIQRRFAGLPALRKQLGLSGPEDFTKGPYSSERARNINKRAHKLEQGIYQYLVQCFGKICVHREYLFTDDGRARTDFFIYHKNGSFSVDVFYPKDKHNLLGCLNSKMRRYVKEPMMHYPVIFLMMNKDITESEIGQMLKNKRKPLAPYQRVMTFKEFQNFVGGREVLPM